jgi:hypothetical protein
LPGRPVFGCGDNADGTAFQVVRADNGKPHVFGWIGPAR